MAKLNAAARNNLPDSSFAVVTRGPNGQKVRKYPMEDKRHAADAMARVAANGSKQEVAKVQHKEATDFSAMAARAKAAKGSGKHNSPKPPAA